MGSSVVTVNRRMQETVLYVEDDLNLTILCTEVESKEVPEIFFLKHLFRLRQVFVAAHRIFDLHCGMGDL